MECLIVYSTKYGSVQKAANLLKARLGGEVTLVNIAQEKVPNLDNYDTVILGGSIYIGKIQKALTNYINSNLSTLLKKRIGLFICAAEPEPIRTKELTDAFPADLFNHAIIKDVVGYEYNIDKLSFLDKLMLRKIKGVTKSKSDISENVLDNFANKILNS